MDSIPGAVLVAAILLPAAAAGQQRPDLGGTWVQADDGSRLSVASRGDVAFRVGDMGSGWGSPLTIGIESTRVFVRFDPYLAYDLQPAVELTYPLSGGDARNQVYLGHSATPFTSRAGWQDGALMTVDLFPVPLEVAGPGVTAEVRRRLTVASDTLRIETTRVGVAGAPTVTSRSIYLRQR